MKRVALPQLIAWKNNPNRKPLILNGARQVGKTYLLKEFGAHEFEQLIYVNFEIDKSVCDFIEQELDPAKVVQFLETVFSKRIKPETTLIVLDEVQVSERALTLLKYFYENAPHYYVVAAGSLLGVAVNREKYSFPVGKVDQMELFPMDFEEFLWALDHERLAEQIREHYHSNETMPEALHELALKLYQQYFVVGGMPEAVQMFVETGSFVEVQTIQNNITNEYVADMAKYAPASTSVKIRAAYQSIPAQLAKENTKFQYKVVQRGGTATIFGEAIEWLSYAGISLKCQRLDQGTVPINAYASLTDFKLYMADIGMLTLRSGMPISMILSSVEENNTFMGAMTENYVAQALASKRLPLYYWASDGKAEVDFVLQLDGKVVPVEVKKGKRTRSKSLAVFSERYGSTYALRISKKNFGFEHNIKSVPLYAVFCI